MWNNSHQRLGLSFISHPIRRVPHPQQPGIDLSMITQQDLHSRYRSPRPAKQKSSIQCRQAVWNITTRSIRSKHGAGNMWQTCTPFVSLFKGCVQKTRSREEYAQPSRTNEVVMGKAERCLRKHTRRTWVSACDHFGHTIWQHWHYGCSLCGISDRLYTLKVKAKNKWIYRTQKSLRAAANWAPRFKWHLWKQLVQRCVDGCCLIHLAAAGSGDSWTVWSVWDYWDSCFSLLDKDIHHSLYNNPDGSKPLTLSVYLKGLISMPHTEQPHMMKSWGRCQQSVNALCDLTKGGF